MSAEQTVFVVDDDAALRDSLRWLIESVGHTVRTFPSARAFLAEYRPDSGGCLVLDVRMPGGSGVELQEQLRRMGAAIPVIFLTGHADVATAVRAMKGGAVDFIEKPFNDQVLLDHIQASLEKDRAHRVAVAFDQEILARYDQLTTQQRRVLHLVAAGRSNRAIGETLGVGIKTVEAHRARVMSRMQAQNFAELLRMAAVCSNAQPIPATD